MLENFTQWLETSEIFPTVLSIGITVILGFILFGILRHVINRTFNNRLAKRMGKNELRNKTLNHMIVSVIRYLLVFIVIVIILGRLGINVTSILAAAGVVGLAVSFGAQSLIKDVFTGFFIILEDQYNVGEHVIINTHEGIVEEVGMRVTKVKGFDGELYIIPNGSIIDVANYCRDNIRVVIDQSISYDSDIEKAQAIMAESAKEYYHAQQEDFAQEPFVAGVQALMDSSVTIRLVAYVPPMRQWDVERGLRKKIKETLDQEGIKIPFPVYEIMQMPTTKEGEEA